ncbi:hypothetical protein [Polaribacter sp. SA4-12]|uniref:hypothetical protein n=1 Tax=Polaribacter sp. SA4-12 TaxID=1312072 RepID=UPI000B3D097A|nr:hypothetical protein [Polaribacter sp. SA4-12]ARV15892.1 hypothetical protein BTO07_12400 [Polaribacter sp. SA4-12]
MEHDIRDLFKNKEYPIKKIPKEHRKDFITKLNGVKNSKNKKSPYYFLKIAASILLILFCGYFYQNTYSKPTKTAFEIQFEGIENEYLININKEWNSFIEVANDTILIRKYKEKLKDSNTDYKKITTQLKELPNNINVLESLIDNLQRRLQLIKDIKEHINELNQKKTSNETIYI